MTHAAYTFLLFFTFSFVSTSCMEPEIASLITVALPIEPIVSHLDFISAKNLISSCKHYYEHYNKYEISRLIVTPKTIKNLQFGTNRLLHENPHMCKLLNSNTYTSALIHYAISNNKVMFKHLISNEDPFNKMDRIDMLRLFGYISKEKDTSINMNAYRKLHNNDTALLRASIINNFTAAEIALQNGANPNTIDTLGCTPLHRAAQNGFLRTAELLLICKANINAIDNNELTPLFYAAYNGHCEIIQLLIDHGAHININNPAGLTPLFFAVKQGLCDPVQLLLDHGADINAKDTTGVSPLHYAVTQGHFDVVKLLLEKGTNINAIDKKGWTALHIATYGGRVEIIELLLNNAADINKPNLDGLTPLHFASHNGDFDAVKLLIKKGAEINATSCTGFTIRWRAANKYPDIMDYLKDYDEENLTDETGFTPLHCAALNGHHETVKLLHKKGAEINAVNSNDLTPLHCAAHKGHYKTIKALLKRGAKINDLCHIGLTPLHYAAEKGHFEVAKSLIKRGADINSAYGHTNWAPLHYAAFYGHLNIVQLLLKNPNCQVNKRTLLFKTALHLAQKNNHDEIVKLLSQYKQESCLIS